jgi:hypothetical protein
MGPNMGIELRSVDVIYANGGTQKPILNTFVDVRQKANVVLGKREDING